MTTMEFPLQLLKEITDNFAEKHVIGRGGYGVVYKGVLPGGEEIALKKLFPVHGLDDTQFTNELNNLMRAQHLNITQLVGYCYNEKNERVKLNDNYVFAHSDEKVICFEYLRGGSLDKHISDESCGFDWPTRFKIIKGICDGLNYLHNGSKDPIYHLDLKPENILLDENMVPKIGDFGLSRLFPSEQTYVTIKVIGTIGYMPPEFIERREITSKFDVFSLGVIIKRIMVGNDDYFKCAAMSSEQFLEHVHENWVKRLQETMSLYTSEQITTCAEIALRCVEIKRENRPKIADIVDELDKLDTAESPSTLQIAKKGSWNSERRGRIIFSNTSRPTEPLDIFSCPLLPSSTADDEVHLTDGVSHNYNGSPIPPAALKTLFKNPKLANEGIAAEADIDAGNISGLVFVSERDDGLETLYIALHFNAERKVKVFALADIFGATDFNGVRLEDSGCIGGGFSVGSRTVDHCLIYVSTKQRVEERGSPRTIVYKTNLTTGRTDRLTPEGVFDLSPAVSPSGKTIAVASFESKSWNGKIKNLKTNIYVMNVDSEEGPGRKLLIENGGWPSWGSDNIIFFHRGKTLSTITAWSVFRYDIITQETVKVTPERLGAMTPAAISETKVAVAVLRGCLPIPIRGARCYRHIEIFDTNGLTGRKVTRKKRPNVDHYSPFVLHGGLRIGYHRCRSESDLARHGDQHVPRNLHRLESPVKGVGLFQLSGVLPSISMDGSKLAFVNKLKEVWVADSQGLRVVYADSGPHSIFSPVWNQNPDKDTLYICIGTDSSFTAETPMEIYAIINACGDAVQRQVQRLTYGNFNNTFPSSSPDGNKFVFQSTRDFFGANGNLQLTSDAFSEKGNSQPASSGFFVWTKYLSEKIPLQLTREVKKKHKNLYIMLKAEVPGSEEGWVTPLTKGEWTDTQCQWSPRGDWIVFSSTRDKQVCADELDNGLDPMYFSVFIVKPTDPTVVIRVMSSRGELGGHINHPVFSPDGRSIAATANLAAFSVDPISLPKFKHAMRQYCEIFMVDIDQDDKKNKDVKGFHRMTHSRYECGAPAWTMNLAVRDTNEQVQWNALMKVDRCC